MSYRYFNMLDTVKKSYKANYLTSFIESFDYYDCSNLPNTVQHILPLGVFHIGFHLNDVVKHNTSFSDGWKKRPTHFLAGPYQKAYLLKATKASRLFLIRFKAGMFHYFTDIPCHKLQNQIFLLDDIWGADSHTLFSHLYHEPNNLKRVKLVESFLLKRQRKTTNELVLECINYIKSNNGVCSLENISKQSSYSPSYLRKKFHEKLGLSPKQFQRIIRVNALVDYYQKTKKVSLTDLSYRFSYYDQSHFIKEFKDITGKTPSLYFDI